MQPQKSFPLPWESVFTPGRGERESSSRRWLRYLDPKGTQRGATRRRRANDKSSANNESADRSARTCHRLILWPPEWLNFGGGGWWRWIQRAARGGGSCLHKIRAGGYWIFLIFFLEGSQTEDPRANFLAIGLIPQFISVYFLFPCRFSLFGLPLPCMRLKRTFPRHFGGVSLFR